MIDKIVINLKNVVIPEEKRKGYKSFKAVSKPNTFVRVKYIALSKQKQSEFYDDILHIEDEIETLKEIDKHRVKVMLIDYLNKGTTTLIVEGSIRKWYFGKDRTQDFKRKEFIHAIDSLAYEIGIEDKSIWNAKVTQLETGLTIRMKDKHRGIISCIFDYKNFKKHTFDEYGVEFSGANYDVIFYDQIRKIYNRKEKKEKTHDKVTKNNFFLRYEIQGHKVSGMDMFNPRLNTLLKIRSNWKYIGENLLNTLNTVMFVNIIDPETYVEVKNGEKKSLSKFLVLKGLQFIGLENFRILVKQMKSKKKPDFKKYFIKVYEDFENKKKENYKDIFTEKLIKKINSHR